MNWPLTLLMYALLIFGVFMIDSAARHLHVGPETLKKFGTVGAYYAAQQKNWIILGTVVYFATAMIDYRWIKWLGVPFYLASMGLMGMAMLQGDKVHRLNLGPISFQPAQLGVISGILLISWLMQDSLKWHRIFHVPLVRISLIALLSAIPFLLVMVMGDMGSALVWIPVAAASLLIAGIPFRYLTFMSFIAAGMLPLVYFVALPLVSKRGPERIDLWLKMMNGELVDIRGEAYAPHNVSMAIGKAGWKGVGWNASIEEGSLHAKRFIPKDTAHNDYIFAVIGEELGFRGSLSMLGVFAAMLIIGLIIAYCSRDMMGRLLCVMIMTAFFAHVFESIGMCTLLMPITGIPLPLVSYSGTFVVICMFMIGLVQSVWIHRHQEVDPIYV